jgi:hypothetical protein
MLQAFPSGGGKVFARSDASALGDVHSLLDFWHRSDAV